MYPPQASGMLAYGLLPSASNKDINLLFKRLSPKLAVCISVAAHFIVEYLQKLANSIWYVDFMQCFLTKTYG